MISKSLRCFHEMVACGSIRKASQKLGSSPSSVSRQISILEGQIGAELFSRTPTGINLTYAGQLVADFAAPFIQQFDDLRRDLNEQRGLARQLIRVAAVPSIAAFQPAATVRRFLDRYNSVVFTFDTRNSGEVLDLVKAGVIDIGLANSASEDPDIRIVSRIGEPMVLVVPQGHELAQRGTFSVSSIEATPLALLHSHFAVRKVLDTEFRKAKLSPNIVLESGSIAILIEMVRAGRCATCLPLRTIPPEMIGKTLQVIRLEEPSFNDSMLDVTVRAGRRLPRLVNIFLDDLTRDLSAITT